ncbi:fumarylacetoacetate hydrolase family protein [Nostocoides japonicum]|nr:fumarylacetoacetate hydrolase family protein [Tetrasphaera japonica]
MRFVRASTPDGPRIGVLVDDDTAVLSPTLSTVQDHLESLSDLGTNILASSYPRVPLDSLSLLRPVDPPSMRDFMVFEEHIKPAWRSRGIEGPAAWYRQPIGYFSNAAGFRGPHDTVEIPGGSQRLDFELEVGAIVSRTLQSVSSDQAESAIAGYLVLCDWSARDLQSAEMEGSLGPFKGKDFATALGPVLVTPDELADVRNGTGYDLRMTTSVNGREYGHDLWSSATWSFEDLLSYASWNSTVEGGALIGSGTCQGGCILELSLRHSPEQYPWLAAGDQVSLSIERLGSIESVVTASCRGPWPGFRDGAQNPHHTRKTTTTMRVES